MKSTILCHFFFRGHQPGKGFFTKSVLVMKLTTILLLITILQVGAKGVAQKVTWSGVSVPLQKVFSVLKQQTGYVFFYDKKDLNAARPVTVRFKETSLVTALEEVLNNQPLEFEIQGNTVFITKKEKISQSLPLGDGPIVPPPTVDVTVVVQNTEGQPLEGASIRVKGTQRGITTDVNGRAIVKAVTPNVTLIISFTGYVDKEVTIVSNKIVTVKLATLSKNLDDVVIIGYGTQKKSNVTSAMSTLSGESFDERSISRVDQALVGQLAGVVVKQTTGIPGKAFSIQIRGSGSISGGNEPLYVVDGFPLTQSLPDAAGGFSGGNALDNLDPNDVESIQVLKDAAAASIYGSRASNGVVLITTKKGKIGKPKIQFNSFMGYSEASKKIKMLSGPGWIDRATEMINAAYTSSYGSKGALASDDSARRVAIIGSSSVSYIPDPRWSKPNYPGLEFVDWQDNLFRKGIMQNYQLSASGGTENVNYFISGNYVNQDGFVIGTGYKIFSARANVETKVNQKLKVGINLAPSYSITEDPGIEGKDAIYHVALSFAPVQEDSVALNANVFQNKAYKYGNATNSPVTQALKRLGETKRFRTIASIYGNYEIIKGLTFKTSVNADFTNRTYSSYTPYTVINQVESRLAQTTLNTYGSYNTSTYQTFVNENTLTYSSVLRKGHRLNVLLGQSYNYSRSDNSNLNSYGGFTSNVIQTLNYAAGITGNSSASKNVLLSYFSRIQYSYRDKYLLSSSLRSDGSSRFGSNNKYGIFPSASLGWRVTEENFMKRVFLISDLKLRASIGVNGNNNISDFGAIPTTASYGYVLGTTQTAVIGQAPNRVANPDLRWEKSTTKDIGLDFGVLKNRITGSFDYYNRLTKDLLLNVAIPEVTGFQTYLSNAGSVRNTGWEVELTTRNITGKFQWTTNLNISHNANKVEALSNGQTQILVPSLFDISHTILRVGETLNSIYVVKQKGILSQADINNKVALYGTETIGDPKYEDYDHNGVIDGNDRQIVGHPNPDYAWGITNTFNFKGFDLKVLIQGQNGGSIYSMLGRAISRTGQAYTDNAPEFYVDRWKSADNPGVGKVSKAYSTFGRIVNTDWLYSSNYMRVRNITLGYNLKNIIKSKAINLARIYVTAENFFGHDKYYGGANPESANTDVSGNGNYPEAADYGGLPLAKSLIIGLNFTF